MSEFKAFSDIERLQSPVTITEKIHGSNAQILIDDVFEPFAPGEKPAPDAVGAVQHLGTMRRIVKAGSRTRWLTTGKDGDNYGFAAWVEANKEALTKALGPGRHYGEWYGSGINSGYGLTKGERRFALFHQKFKEPFAAGVLPHGLEVVPVLYSGPFREGLIQETMTRLKLQGSFLSPGFMRPEGIVVRFERNGALFKHVFEAEETAWKGGGSTHGLKAPADPELQVKASLLLQPIRLEKLLSRDEAYMLNYPQSLASLASAYVADLEKEGQLAGLDEAVVKAARKNVFGWIKAMLKEKGLAA